jgi:hypothetical protein
MPVAFLNPAENVPSVPVNLNIFNKLSKPTEAIMYSVAACPIPYGLVS